ncbi:hypothetical protein EZY14_018995 [Kordia sp. TARA_039_SRF]|jgi:hypothetical protein|nr:hypothetical protein EZY14_018995 [Kordia sp. TARA_039_SRF]
MLKKISALHSVRELSKKEQHAIHGGAGYLCTSSIMDGVYHSEDDISGDYGNGHVISCTAASQAVGNPKAAK